MSPNPKQSEMVSLLREHTHRFDQVIVFGSYARGEAYSTSDFDVLLIDSSFSGWNLYPSGGILSELWNEDFPELHLITCSHEEFHRRYCNDEEMANVIADEGFNIHTDFGFIDYVRNINCDEN